MRPNDPPHPPQTVFSAAQKSALTYLDARRAALSEWCATIFDFGETAWREYRSAEWYVSRLRNEGFSVEAGSAGMDTAFCAEWHNTPCGPGPVIGLYAEYDGIPGNCQAPEPRRQPRAGLGYQAGGHTDPHSGLGIAGLGAALAIKAAMEQHAIPGGIRFTGEPAEKLRGSKPIHAAKGYYDGLAAILSFHPFYMLPMCNTVRWDTHCGAAYAMVYRFLCDEPEKWAQVNGAPIPQAHSAVRAPGAGEALSLMSVTSKALRESALTHQGGWTLSEAVLTHAQATADNLPAGLAELQYMIRVPTLAMAEAMTAALDRNAAAVAAMTGCRWERHWVSKSRPGLANHAMAGMVWENLKQLGAPHWGEPARDIARQIQRELGLAPMDDPFLPEMSRLTDPQSAEDALRRDLPPSQRHSTSDDYTDMCWHAPTARFYIARPALKAPAGFAYPAWVMNALGGIPATIDPMVERAAQLLAVSGLRVLEDAALRHRAMAEFNDRTGGGIGGSDWIAPLCDYEAPLHFRWPEYVTTHRGHDWWIPAAMPGA